MTERTRDFLKPEFRDGEPDPNSPGSSSRSISGS